MAGSIIRKFTKWFFISLNIIGCVVFLLTCLSPVVSPVQFGLSGFLAMAAPYVIGLLIFSVIFWLIAKPIVALVPIITLLIGYKQVSVAFAWHPLNTFSNENKSDSALRIISWNVRGMYGVSTNDYKQKRNRNEIASLINDLNPDIICLQEFNNSISEKNKSAHNIDLFTGKCPHYYFSRDFKSKNLMFFGGSILFSKYPIIDSGKIKFPGNFAESLIYADIVKGKDTIRVFTTHLQSFQFSETDYANIEKLKDPDAEALEASESIYSKMKLAFTRRTQQADMVRKAIDKSPYPSFVCGDFNDVPNSYTYFKIRGGLQDAFLATSFGIGKSYNALAPTLRIDYIMPDNNFNVTQFDMVDEGLSDHHMLVTDISLKK